MNKVLSDECLGAKLGVTENRCVIFNRSTYVYMLWFKFILGLKLFELVSILFSIVPDCGNE